MSELGIICTVGGFVLAALGFVIGILSRALSAAKATGAKGQREEDLRKDVDAAHATIREEVMPRLSALEQARGEDAVRFENIAASQAKTEASIAKVLDVVTAIGEDLSYWKGRVSSRVPRTKA